MQRGFSVLEMLIAMTIALVVMSGVVASSGGIGSALRGYQTTVLGGQMNAEAVRKAQEIAEHAQALAREDFDSLNPVATSSIDGFYYKNIDVFVQPDFLSKLITTTISWRGAHGATSSTRVSSLATNLENANSPNTCNSTLSGDWSNAQIEGPFYVDNSHSNASGNPVSAIDAFRSKLYITTNNQHGHNEDFYIYDIAANPIAPTLVNSVELNGVTAGFNAVDTASVSGTLYAFIANAHDRNFFTCAAAQNCSQFQVIEVTDPLSIMQKMSFKLSTSSAPYVWGNTSGSNGQAVGKSIVYYNGYLYLGLSTTQNGPSFHIIDVHDPLHPTYVGSWPAPTLGFGSSGAPINAITLHGSYAYLAHPNGLVGALNEQLTVLDVSNPSNPVRVSGFSYATGVEGNGKSISRAGSRLYFGRTKSKLSGTTDSIPELFILDGSDPIIPSTALGSTTLASGQSILGIAVRDYLAFLTTSGFLQIWDVSVPSGLSLVKSFDFVSVFGSGSTGGASDCEGNNVYVGAYRASNDKGAILVIHPGP